MSHSHTQPLLDKISSYFDVISSQKLQQDSQIPRYAGLDPRLFCIENETLGQCVAEARNTLQALQQSSSRTESEFYAERLVAQYHALLEIIHPETTAKPHFIAANPITPTRKKEKHHIHDLPPAERLEKYYQFLTQLNDLIAQQNEQTLSCEDSTQQQQLIEKVKITEQRKQRCLDAIDNLEEYLLFVAERDKS